MMPQLHSWMILGLSLGTLSMLDCNMFPGLEQEYLVTEVNMFLLPMQENDGEDTLTKTGYIQFIFNSTIVLF